MTNAIRILGLDPGLRRTGWGVIACEGSRLIHLAHGVATPPETAPFAYGCCGCSSASAR